MIRGKLRIGSRAGWLAIAAPVLLLQACAQQAGPTASGARVYASDLAGAAKKCDVSKVTLTAGQNAAASMTLGNDGGWCGLSVANGNKPYDAGLLTVKPVHGKVQIHTVGDITRIDYTPDLRFTGTDAFTVKLIPGDPSVRVAVTVTP